VLSEFYISAKEEDENGLEIVFVSSDRDDHSFEEYYGSMPWTALPFSNQANKRQLAEKFGVSGIPMLVVLDKDGNVKDTNGRSTVSNSRGNTSAAFSKWH
jgi:nucleoredoxin